MTKTQLRRRGPAVTVNLDREDHARLKTAAKDAGISLSAYARERLLRPQQVRFRERAAFVRSLSRIAVWLELRYRFAGPDTNARIVETLGEVRQTIRDMRDGVL